LGGLSVLDGGELEDERMSHHLSGLEVDLVAVEVVGAVEAIVKVAEDGGGECGSVALEAVGLDVAAEIDLHACSFG
jgi:hypothetical protein